jgi:TonB-linked SusC/RagA family outer membrane protein
MLFLFSIFLMGSIYAQERTVSGTVFDNTGMSLPGVNVVIKGTTTGVVTDLDGKFSIKVPNNQTVLEVRYVGYESQEITVGDQTSIKITLAESVKEIDQIIVIGYGTQKKSDLTGAVASISAKDLKSVPMTRIDEAMEGRAAGVNVVAATGMPGGSRNIQIRGVSSINGFKPLIVVDGISTTDDGVMNRLNPSDIESIEILKDAASAAIYGSSGGNGVVIINTKKGKAGKISTSINSYYGFQEASKKIDLMNTRQWNNFYTAMNKKPYIFSEDSLRRSTDWQDEIFRTAPIKNVDLSVSGGSEKSQFAIGSNYLKQDGLVKNTGYQKLIFSISSQHQVTKHIKIDEVVRFTHQKTDGPAEGTYQNVYNNFTTMRALLMPTFLTPYDANGKWSVNTDVATYNPMVGIDARSNNHIKDMNVEGNVGFYLEFFKGLVFSSKMGASQSLNENWTFLPKYYSWSKDAVNQNQLTQQWRKSYSYTFQNYVTFDRTFFDVHNLTVMAGMEASDWGDYDINGYRLNYISTTPELLYFDNSSDAASPSQIIKGSGKEAKSAAYYGRVNYNYKSMILAQFNYRYDGMSNFGPNNKWGAFKSGSVGFKFTELEAVKNLNIFSFGKLRFGIGESGQFPISTYWPYASSILNTQVMNYAFDDATIKTGVGPVQIPNPDLQWETVTTTNIGADLGFFKDKLNVTAEYFIKKNDKMIMPKETPSLAGTALYSPGAPAELGGTGIKSTFPYVNYGTVQNKGFEITLDYKKNFGDLNVNFGFNFTYQTNEITKLAQDSTVQGAVHEITPLTISKVGHSIGEFIGYRFNGLYRDGDTRVKNKAAKRYVYADQPYRIDAATGDTLYAVNTALPGDAKWKDTNKDGVVNQKDYDYLGSYIPPYVFGFNLGADYKGIDFSVFFQGVYGNEIFNGLKRYLHTWEDYGNHGADVVNRYHLPVVYNGVTVDPGNLTSNMPEIRSQNWMPPSDLYIEDGSYLRLRTLTLGYTLPKKLVNKIGLERLRFYFIGKNLITWTNYTGYDPELSNSDPKLAGIDISGYPQTKQYTFGVNVDF